MSLLSFDLFSNFGSSVESFWTTLVSLGVSGLIESKLSAAAETSFIGSVGVIVEVVESSSGAGMGLSLFRFKKNRTKA